jgi:hypothetical protein
MYFELNKRQKEYVMLTCNRLPIHRIEQEFTNATGLDNNTSQGWDAFDDWIYQHYKYCVIDSDIYYSEEVQQAIEDLNMEENYYYKDIDNE